jgi:hypothetical protein
MISCYVSYPVGVLVAIAALAFMPLFLFPIWMVAFVAVDWKTRSDSD